MLAAFAATILEDPARVGYWRAFVQAFR